MSRIFEDNARSIGSTPLVELRRLGAGVKARIVAKIEGRNPAYSVKCRIGAAMIWAAEKEGRLRPGVEVIEPTSGNTGIALGFVCASRGYRLTLTMPETMSLERRRVLAAFGATLVITPGAEGMRGAIRKAAEIMAADPEKWFMPQQFDNPANPSVHRRTSAHEILRAMEGLTIDAFVAGVGTGGTVSGVAPELRKHHPAARIVAVEPDACATISRGERGPTKIQGLAAGFVPKNFDASVVDEVRTVKDDDAWRTKLLLARSEGLLVGISAGANVAIALDLAKELGPGKHVVTVLPDTGERYFSLEEYFTHVTVGGEGRR